MAYNPERANGGVKENEMWNMKYEKWQLKSKNEKQISNDKYIDVDFI